MNILILYKDSGKGGVANHARMTVKGLRSRGIKVILAGQDGLGTQTLLKDCDVSIIDFSEKNPIKIIQKINKIVVDNRIDIIFALNRICAFYSSIVCKFHRKIYYVWANDQVPIPYDIFHRVCTKYGQMAITCSQEGYEMLKNNFHVPQEKIRVVNIGVGEKFFSSVADDVKNNIRENYGIKNDEKVILLYGRLVESKGHMFLLNALSELELNVKYKVLFPGDGVDEYKREITDYLDEHGMKDKVIFTGFADGRELLSVSDLMVLPSVQEGYAISCIEALCMGVPVIRTKTGGYEDTKEYCTGVDYGDVKALASEIDKFFFGDEKFAQKTQKALNDREKFSEKHMIDQYIDIYNSILSNQ